MANAFDTFADPSAASQGSLIPSLPGTSPNDIFNIGNAVGSAESQLGLTQPAQSSSKSPSFTDQFLQGLGNYLWPQLGVPGVGPGSTLDPTGTTSTTSSTAPPGSLTILQTPGRIIAVIIGIIFIIVGLVLLGKSPIIHTVTKSGKQLATAA
jgi:hypothetical protein